MAKKKNESIFLQHIKSKKDASKIAVRENSESDYDKIKNKIDARVMLPRDVLRLFHMTHNKLVQWEKFNVRFSSKKYPKDRSWRRFSISDLLCFAILSVIRDLGISLKESTRLIDWMRSIDLIDSILPPILQGKKVGIYFNRIDIEGIYISSTNEEKMFLKKINKTWTPIVYVPLFELFIWLLKEAKRPDFYIKVKDGIEFYVDKKRADIEDLPTTISR